ncbi:MAG: hypothetical protein K8T90_19220 [Planctomycetes bacterium]|nr:hypothetical protein [Planctomycetota bacterium]
MVDDEQRPPRGRKPGVRRRGKSGRVKKTSTKRAGADAAVVDRPGSDVTGGKRSAGKKTVPANAATKAVASNLLRDQAPTSGTVTRPAETSGAAPGAALDKAILSRDRKRSRQAQEELFALLYDTLRDYARAMMLRQRRDHTLQPTALVHEAYAKLFGRQRTWQNRAHFLGTIVTAMHSLLTDHARSITRQKRGRSRRMGGTDPDTVETAAREGKTSMSDWVDVAAVIEEMSKQDAVAAEIAQYRLLGGFDLPEIAKLLKTPLRTVERKWAWACAVLRDKLQ